MLTIGLGTLIYELIEQLIKSVGTRQSRAGKKVSRAL